MKRTTPSREAEGVVCLHRHADELRSITTTAVREQVLGRQGIPHNRRGLIAALCFGTEVHRHA